MVLKISFSDALKKEILNQITDVVKDYKETMGVSGHKIGQIPDAEVARLITRMRALIERFCDKNSPYFKEMKIILTNRSSRLTKQIEVLLVPSLLGVLMGFYSDVKADYTKNIMEIIHSDLFSDFLEMADYLLKEGFKDAGAVIAGSTLESQLRLLCEKNAISITFESKNVMKPKNANRMNEDLAGSTVYKKLDQKSITSWLDLRNNAAHGKYTEYTDNQVKHMIMGIRDFINRNPA